MADKPSSDWLRTMVRYLRDHIHDKTPTKQPPPVQWDQGKPHTGIHGSPNQKWLEVACGIASQDPWWLKFTIDRYHRELEVVGHEETEENSASHAWQHLTAHYAIRTMAISRSAKPGYPTEYEQILILNTQWCGGEIGLMRTFYVPGAGVVAPGARYEGYYVSSQRSAIAEWDAADGKKAVRVPKKSASEKYTDTYCQELAAALAASGDDLGRAQARIPLLAFPVYVERKPDLLRSYWEPSSAVLKPVYFIQCAGKEVTGALTPEKATGDFVTIQGPAAV
jgi:hypothetical protein